MSFVAIFERLTHFGPNIITFVDIARSQKFDGWGSVIQPEHANS